MEMSEDVNTDFDVPEDLFAMCHVAKVADDEVADIMPPPEVVTIVMNDNRELADEQYLTEWLTNRERLWAKAEEIYEILPEPDPNNLPVWMTQPWALPIQSRWGAGLSHAITAAEEWLANQ